jgi:hypothetical protein
MTEIIFRRKNEFCEGCSPKTFPRKYCENCASIVYVQRLSKELVFKT